MAGPTIPGNFAVVAGVNNYPGIAALQGPENDARAFHQWLISSGAVPPENASLILGGGFPAETDSLDQRPTTTEIDCRFERILRLGVQQGKLGDTLFIFLAGHGLAPEFDASALLLANTHTVLGTTGHYIDGVCYAQWFAATGFFSNVALFMDCCRDDMPRAPSRIPPWQVIHNASGANTRLLCALATRWSRKAREDKLGDNGEMHGYFTGALLKALTGAAGPDGVLRTTGLKNFVLNYFQQTYGPLFKQKGLPLPEPDFQRADDFVLATGIAPRNGSVHVNFSVATQANCSRYVILNGLSFAQIAVNATAANPWLLDLPTGTYAVLDPANTDAPRAPFQVFAGGTFDVTV